MNAIRRDTAALDLVLGLETDTCSLIASQGDARPVLPRNINMTNVSRRVAGISSILVIALLSTEPVGAQTMDHGKSHAEMSRSQGESPYADTKNSIMHSMETVEETDDPDTDFLLLMIPHHQSAVDMARPLLERSDDAEVAAMAQDVIDTQEAEISARKAMLARLGYTIE